jgi:hypothetical protein
MTTITLNKKTKAGKTLYDFANQKNNTTFDKYLTKK